MVDRKSAANGAIYVLMGAGMQGSNGPPTTVSIQLYKILCSFQFGLDTITLKKTHFNQLNLHLRSLLRRLQSLPDTTANEAISLGSGIPLIEGLVDKAIVSLVTCISHKPSSIAYRLAI